jgi:hypothetical protein
MTTVGGDIFQGFFINNKLHGQGIKSFANGEIFEGLFKDGHLSK